MKKAKRAILAKASGLRIAKNNAGVIVGFAVLFIVLCFSAGQFFTASNLTNVARQITANMLVSCGLCLVLIYGAIDLSVGAILGLSACLSAGFMTWNHMPWPVAVLLAILIGVGVGAFNGFLVTTTNIPPFIVTFAVQNIVRGVCRVYTGEKTIVISDPGYIFLGTGSIGPVPVQVFWVVFALALTALILYRTTLGRHIYATGGSRITAEHAGIHVKRVGMFVYMFSAFMASLAGIYTASRTYAAMYTTGEDMETLAISSIVLGGVSMLGGSGGVLGVFLGVLLIGVLNNGMNLLGINSSWQLIVQGAFILVAVYSDFIRKKKKEGM